MDKYDAEQDSMKLRFLDTRVRSGLGKGFLVCQVLAECMYGSEREVGEEIMRVGRPSCGLEDYCLLFGVIRGVCFSDFNKYIHGKKFLKGLHYVRLALDVCYSLVDSSRDSAVVMA